MSNKFSIFFFTLEVIRTRENHCENYTKWKMYNFLLEIGSNKEGFEIFLKIFDSVLL